MIETVEASELAAFLRRSRWIYPLVNAGHILGIALLVGSVIPMDIAALRGWQQPWLRLYAFAGFVLAAGCGALLFMAQASEYIVNGWFRLKIALICVALLNAALHLTRIAPTRTTAALSLILWPAALISGRMIAYS